MKKMKDSQVGALQNVKTKEKRKKRVMKNLSKTLKTWSYQLCHFLLQKYHYSLQNYKNATIGPKCWPNDMDKQTEMAQTWQ